MSVFIADRILGFFVVIFAVWTLIAHLSILIGLSFQSLCYLYSVIVLAGAFTLIIRHWHARRVSFVKEYERDFLVISLLLALAVSGSVLSICALRYDADDVGRLARTVYFLENLHVPLDLAVYDEYAMPQPVTSFFKLFLMIELFWGYIAWVFGLTPLDIYHFVVPVIGGFLIPFTWFFTISRFNISSSAALLGATAICAFLIIDGAQHRSFGNFAFVRIWQGKAILMSIFAPLLVAYSIRFFQQPGLRNWISLFFLCVAGVGSSSSACFLLPIESVFLGVGFLAASESPWRKKIGRLLPYYSAFGYLVLMALCLRFQVNLEVMEHAQRYWPQTLPKQYDLVFGSPFSYSSIIFLVSILGVFCFGQGTVRRFMLGWFVSSVFFVMNPLLFPVLKHHVTSANAYWRLFYTLPFPLSIGMVVAILWQHAKIPNSFLTAAFAVFVLIGTVFNIFPNKVTTLAKIPLGFGQYKLPVNDLDDALVIVSVANPGLMLAPERYSRLIPLLTSKFPQVRVRGHQVSHDAEQRTIATAFVQGSDLGFEEFTKILNWHVQTVVLDISKYSDSKAIETLEQKGFQMTMLEKRFALFSRK